MSHAGMNLPQMHLSYYVIQSDECLHAAMKALKLLN